jgi:hypothetical protein
MRPIRDNHAALGPPKEIERDIRELESEDDAFVADAEAGVARTSQPVRS